MTAAAKNRTVHGLKGIILRRRLFSFGDDCRRRSCSEKGEAEKSGLLGGRVGEPRKRRWSIMLMLEELFRLLLLLLLLLLFVGNWERKILYVH